MEQAFSAEAVPASALAFEAAVIFRSVAHDLRPLLHAAVACVGVDLLLLSVQEFGGLGDVVFSTRNQFHGLELGVAVETQRCNWLFDASLKLAFRNSHSQVTIDGQTTTTVPLPAGGSDIVVTGAGLLAQPTNIGTYGQSALAVIPELAINLGYNFTPRLRATCGYTFWYWSQVARPGDQIDTELNLTQLEAGGLVGAARPEFRRVLTDVWAQGVNAGLDYRF